MSISNLSTTSRTGARHSCPVPSDSTGSSSLPEKGQDDRDVGQCVDTSTGGVDTRSVFQKTFWVNWDSVSTLAQVVSTLEAFLEHHLGGFGTVCRHYLKCAHE
ncbi:hypothetical protein Taro_044958 [Colocasia esculenta]|uniref:Uncharacterized protein n=1 Tax=Colocasia esculenta TaxID=4460 RepID=A0A843WVV5_COLES|nr:hypothetical protein [Colocasia esculenta]